MILRSLFAAALALTAPLAFAQALAPLLQELPLPAKGLWLTLTEPGAGYAIDHRPDGFMFVAVYTYGAQRQPIFYTMQGQLEVLPAAERAATGVYARLRADLNRAVDGTCFGCTYQAPAITVVAGGPAELRFRTATRGEFQFGAYVTQLDAPAIGPDVGKGIEGDWVVLWKRGNVLAPPQFIRIGRVASPVFLTPAATYSTAFPRFEALPNQYSLACLEPLNGEPNPCTHVFFEPSLLLISSADDGRAVAHYVSPNNRLVYLDAYTVMQEPDRLLIQRMGGATAAGNLVPDEVVMRRLPANARRTDETPYPAFPPNAVFPWN